LRTSKGIDYSNLRELFGEVQAIKFRSKIQKFIDSGHINFENGVIRLSDEGIFIADFVIQGVFA